MLKKDIFFSGYHFSHRSEMFVRLFTEYTGRWNMHAPVCMVEKNTQMLVLKFAHKNLNDTIFRYSFPLHARTFVDNNWHVYWTRLLYL